MSSWIARLVRLDRNNPSGLTFCTSAAYGAGPRLFGGLIAAQALAAAGATVAPGRLPHSLHGYFISGGRIGVDIEFIVELTRDGRSFSNRRVTARQDGVTIFEMLTSFHCPEATPDWYSPAAPRLSLADATTLSGLPEWWADHFEIRVAPGSSMEWPMQPFWFRTRSPIEDDVLLRACVLAFISDIGLVSAARPPGPAQRPSPGAAASLDHALWFHRPGDPHQWHLYDAVGISHNDARGFARGSITAPDGTLVASVVQESLWRA